MACDVAWVTTYDALRACLCSDLVGMCKGVHGVGKSLDEQSPVDGICTVVLSLKERGVEKQNVKL